MINTGHKGNVENEQVSPKRTFVVFPPPSPLDATFRCDASWHIDHDDYFVFVRRRDLS
jgi:hypothetical protein